LIEFRSEVLSITLGLPAMGKITIGHGKLIRFNIMVAGESGQGKTTFLRTCANND